MLNDIKIKIYYNDSSVFYGDAVTEDVKATCKSLEVDLSIPPENYYVKDGVLLTKPSYKPFEFALQLHLDMIALEHGYDNAQSFALRAAYPGPYQEEGIKFAQWMDDCWLRLYSSENVSNTDEFIKNLPLFKID